MSRDPFAVPLFPDRPDWMTLEQQRQASEIIEITDNAPPRPPAIAIMVSKVDQQFIDDARRRSIELAFQRGHIRR